MEEHAVSLMSSSSILNIRFLLAALAAVSVALVAFFLPETSHGPLPHQILCEERGKKFVPYVFNPLTSLGLLRWPNIRFIVGRPIRVALTSSALHPAVSCFSYTSFW
jgi:hypothetical protein